MKKQILIIFLLILNLTLFSQSKDKEYYTDIAKGMGYYFGMELTLDLIVEKYPTLSREAMNAKMNLKIAHEKSIENMESIYGQASGENMGVFKKEIINRILTEYDYANFSSYEATAYLHNFEEERIKGNHELYGEFVGILLSHNSYYQSNQAKEFLDDFKSIFHSDNHPKSKGLNLSIEYPKSWTGQEGKRPNILTLIQSSDKNCIITLLIKDVLAEMGENINTLSHEDVEYFKSGEFANEMFEETFTYDYAKEFVDAMGLENIKDFEFKKTKIDAQPTMIAKARGVKSTILAEIEVYTINYLILYNHYMISVGVMIQLNEQDNTKAHIEKYELLSALITNSLIIKDQW